MSARIDPGTVKTEKWPATVSRIAVGVGGYPEGKDAIVLAAAIARATQAELMLVAVHPWRQMPGWSLRPTSLFRARWSVCATGASRPACRGFEPARPRRPGADRQALAPAAVSLQMCARDRAALNAQPAAQELRRIGVGYDGGPESEAALSLAGSIAGAAGAELHLCGVVDTTDCPQSAGQRWQRAARPYRGGRTPSWRKLPRFANSRSIGPRGSRQHARRGPPRASG